MLYIEILRLPLRMAVESVIRPGSVKLFFCKKVHLISGPCCAFQNFSTYLARWYTCHPMMISNQNKAQVVTDSAALLNGIHQISSFRALQQV